jgi:hypothetical protein
VFKLLLTVFLGLCIGAVVADQLFGPDQPAMPSSDSLGERWEPWRSWYRSLRLRGLRGIAAARAWLIAAGHRVAGGTRGAARWTRRSATATARLVPDTWQAASARRTAMAQRTAAHARHVAHLEAATERLDPLPPPVAPPLRPAPIRLAEPFDAPTVTPPAGLASVTAVPSLPPDAGGWDAPAAGPEPLPPTEPQPIPQPLGTGPQPGGPLGRPPWDALVRRPMPPEAPTPRRDGRDGQDGRDGRPGRRRRRDPLAWQPDQAARPPDPEWEEGVPTPVRVPVRTRVRSGAVLLALTGVFGVIAATMLVLAVLMAVHALDSL